MNQLDQQLNLPLAGERWDWNFSIKINRIKWLVKMSKIKVWSNFKKIKLINLDSN